VVLRHWVVGSCVGPRRTWWFTIKPLLGFLTKPNQTMVKTWFSGCVGSHPRTKIRSKAKLLSNLRIEDELKREREKVNVEQIIEGCEHCSGWILGKRKGVVVDVRKLF